MQAIMMRGPPAQHMISSHNRFCLFARKNRGLTVPCPNAPRPHLVDFAVPRL